MFSLKNISKSFKDNKIYENLNFDFPKNGLTCILGASGSGKSTLLNMLAGFDTSYNGNLLYNNIDLKNLKDEQLASFRKVNIGFVFQDFNLLKGYSVLDNILLACDIQKNNKAEFIKKAESLLEKVNLSDKKNSKIENLSGGQKQRVALVRALITSPNVILADEPTGSLDRKTSNEIMEILKDISKTKLVIIITHDKKICEFANQILEVKNKKLEVIKTNALEFVKTDNKINNEKKTKSKKTYSISLKNIKVNFGKYFLICFIIAISVLASILSLSFNNVTKSSINEFKEKNIAYNNGFVKNPNENIFMLLNNNKKVTNVFYQYKLFNLNIKYNNGNVVLKEKYPTAKAKQSLSYGLMPKNKNNEIAISPSLAIKLSKNIKELIGQTIVLTVDNIDYTLKICGIFNADFDDIIVSSNVEKKFYENKQEKPYSLNFDTIELNDIIEIHNFVVENGNDCQSAKDEVFNIKNTFDKIQKMFIIIAVLVLVTAIFITIVILTKLQKTRHKEIGLYGALGFSKKSIKKIIINENLIIAFLSCFINLILLGISYFIFKACNILILLTPLNIVLSLLITALLIFITCYFASRKLIKLDPAEALKN